MARKERISELGYYHVISRGVEKRNIFLEPSDYDKFLSLLKDAFKEYKTILHSYCLMTNHYHLLIEITEKNISDVMKRLNSNYSIYFNKKYERTGHLWQGRFHSYFLYDDTHFWNVAKYIERNPIKAKIVSNIDKYEYQSFCQRKKSDYVSEVLAGSKIYEMSLTDYEEFISTDLDNEILEKIYFSPKIIKKNGEKIILLKRLESFFELDNNSNRNSNVIKAYEYGYKKTQIANCLNLSPKTIDNIIKAK